GGGGGIRGEGGGGVERGPGMEIGLEQRAHRRRDRRGDQALDAGVPFAAAARFLAGKIVEAGARMSVDNAEGCGLDRKVCQDAGKRGVLDDVGEVAGVKGVAGVHRARSSRRWAASSPAPADGQGAGSAAEWTP